MVNILDALKTVVVKYKARYIWTFHQVLGDLFKALIAQVQLTTAVGKVAAFVWNREICINKCVLLIFNARLSQNRFILPNDKDEFINPQYKGSATSLMICETAGQWEGVVWVTNTRS
jgi:hypothetical protein